MDSRQVCDLVLRCIQSDFGVIGWLRSLASRNKPRCPGRPDWRKRGELTLTHQEADGHFAALSVPVEIQGKPPVIAFRPACLADALEIGSTPPHRLRPDPTSSEWREEGR